VDLELLEVLSSANSALSDAGSRQYLRAARRQIEDDGLRVNCRTVVNDDTGRVIARFLRKRDCSLAVIAMQRPHGIERGAFGRLTMNLIAQSPCPVWVCATRSLNPYATTGRAASDTPLGVGRVEQPAYDNQVNLNRAVG
jgi:nucleotide-binding universal stress UspA family protein